MKNLLFSRLFLKLHLVYIYKSQLLDNPRELEACMGNTGTLSYKNNKG